MTSYEKLTKANHDYHEAVDEILCDGETITDTELRAEVKVQFGKYVKILFDMMRQANEQIKPYYEVT